MPDGGRWWRAISKAAVTGIVITQANSWDRAFGASVQQLFSFSDDSTLMLFAQALVTTSFGMSLVLLLQRLNP